MESGAKASSGVRKVKKKQVKDELDRIKQAEKKKRRLEKALATSAAIRSELEKKKQKKKEEQQRLDEEGAAIAEAVALQVLLGEDSDDDSCNVMLRKDEEFNPWNCCANSFDLFMGGRREAVPPCHGHSENPTEEIGWVNPHQSRDQYYDWGNCSWTVSTAPYMEDLHDPYFNEGGWEAEEISAGLIAAQAVSSLQIAEDEHVHPFVF